ncbi:hypothetical protein B7R22_11240 [Subtercola boreus]|uniref:F420-dependent oxidoreductase n=1 Tax=Subtercola boreus TaxID=120213 RepID=A0A3E0VX93_9MICO|nr:Pr6Pr family membrane protein [Subtercola boreus]RFA14225.1 hypothetical protein B7R22_11240 [Subtercola boreus]
MKLLFTVLRVVIAAAIATAVIGQLAHTANLANQANPASVGFVVVNFFSFFTIDSNVASIVVLVAGAALVVRRVSPDPMLFTTVRAAVVTYMVTTGIVYNLLLRGIALPQGQTLAWSNEILHVIAPIYLLLDWLFAPGRVPLDWKRLWTILAFPIVWVVYTLVRGPLAIDGSTGANWYPYPFLNPATSPNGYLSVTFYVILIALVITAIGAGTIRISRGRTQSRLT